MDSAVKMIILNGTTWPPGIAWPHLYYGYLIFCTDPRANFLNIKGFKVSSLGKAVNVTRTLSLEEAQRLDKMDGTGMYEEAWHRGERGSCRFEDPETLMQAGLKAWEALQTNLPFISLMEGCRFQGTLTRNENGHYYLPRYTYPRGLREWQALTPGSPWYDGGYAACIADLYGSAEAYLNSGSYERNCREAAKFILFDTDPPH